MKELNTCGLPSSKISDIVLLLSSGGFENAEVMNMITKAKEKYVDSRHSNAITQLHSSNKYKDGKWKTYVDEDGKRKEVVRKTREELYEHLYEFYKAADTAAMTFEQAFEHLMQRKKDELNRSYATILDYRRYFSYLSETLKKTPLVEITESDLRTWLVKSYLPTKPKESALRKMLQLLKQIFDYGMRKRICYDNPAQYLRLDDYVKDCNLKKKRPEEREFSKKEIALLRSDALATANNPRSLMRLFAIETGLRAGELSALLWSDIDDADIHIHRQQLLDKSSGHQVFYDVEYTKDERTHPHGGRYIPRTSGVNEVLELAKKLSGASEYIFHDKTGKPISKSSYMLHLRRSCDRLGIATRNNHAFRVARNSLLFDFGLAATDRALLLGHDVQTNERYYSVYDQRNLDEIRKKLKEKEL